jgi:hypothetical protein
MKTFFLIPALLCIFSINNLQAKIFRVNNDASKDPNFTSINAAIANPSVFNGDTVHIEPSTVPYPISTISKRVIIIGSGYFLAGAGSNSGLQQNPNTSKVEGFIFIQGTAGTPTSGASGCSLSGLEIIGTSAAQFNALQLNNVANIKITRCLINGNINLDGYAATVSGISINKCFIVGGITTTNIQPAASVDLTFENDIFSSIAGAGSGSININLPTNIKGLFRNNIFNESAATLGLSNFYVSNNIFTSAAVSSTNQNNVYKNNIFVSSAPGNGIIGGTLGNVTGANITHIFSANVTSSSTIGDSRFNLLIGGPNPNPANNGGETFGAVITPACGAYGATDPYRPSGIPAVPAIYNLIILSSVPTGGTSMQISLSIRSNN